MNTPQFKTLTKTNERWKWMAGATAITAAVAPHAQAQTAQISLIDNQIETLLTSDHLSFSVTNGYAFGSIAGPVVATVAGVGPRANEQFRSANVPFRLNGSAKNVYGMAACWFTGTAPKNFVAGIWRGAYGAPSYKAYGYHSGYSKQKAFALVPFTLTDPAVDAGQTNTNALLEIEAFNQSDTDETVAFLAIFYDTDDNNTPNLTIDPNAGTITDNTPGDSINVVGTSNGGNFTAVPEPSGLALLALGAGGILARRRFKKAA